MKTIRSILAVGILVPFATGCGTPSPEAVCKHAVEIMKKESKEGEDEKQGLDECKKRVEKMKEKMGEESYATFAKCAVKASDENGLEECAKSAMKAAKEGEKKE